MPDREKVIKGLECCLGSNDCDIEPEEDCPYKGMCLCAMALRLDVIAMLKEQDAVEPKHNPLSPTDWFCGKCGMCISRFHDYCPSCGQEVKWE